MAPSEGRASRFQKQAISLAEIVNAGMRKFFPRRTN
jgi:hypothetical protein